MVQNPRDSQFILSKVFSNLIEILNFLHPFKSEDDKNVEFENLKDAIYTLIKKSIEPGPHPYLKHNMAAIISSTFDCMKH